MSIKIDKQKCISCGKCLNACPGNLIYRNPEGKAFIKYLKDCWGCTACLKECPSNAIHFYLETDIGGKGGYLYTTNQDNDYQEWHIIDKNKKETVIKINRKESNKY